MENQIIINIPEGKKAIQEMDKDGNIIIKYVDAEPIHSKSWEEFCKNHPKVINEYYVSSFSWSVQQTNPGLNYTRHTKEDRGLTATADDSEGIIALIQLTRLHDEWVGNWKKSIGETCYNIHQIDGVVSVYRYKVTHSLLSFPTKEMADEFLDCFKDLITKAKKFI